MASRERVRLPTGTLTFLFTDIEGSTRLLQELGEAFSVALEEHHQIMRSAIAAHDGIEVNTEGDAFFVVFERAADAVATAIEAQRALAVTRSKVRMGMHTGDAALAGDDYVGLAVHAAARVAGAAHGGQVLVSDATRAVIGSGGLKDLGEHEVRDIGPMRLWQVAGEGLQADFPPLRTAAIKGNLPKPRTSFVGRDSDLKELTSMIGTQSMVTLTGIGGVGKTRLAIEAARVTADRLPGGAWFIDLAPVTDPGLVLQTAVDAFSLQVDHARDPAVVLKDFLSEREALVIIDNCEHLLDASANLAIELLHASDNLHVIATSREPLGVPGESVWRVPSLAADAPELFVERARAAGARLEIDATVERICERLDGIPLAIELAAARAAILDVSEIAGRLDDRFRLSSGIRPYAPRSSGATTYSPKPSARCCNG